MAVVGVGRAGRARVRALGDHPETQCVAEVGRTGSPTFEQTLGDARVDAVIVCTPNRLHPEMVRAGLEAGKHIAVEFPLAPSRALGRRLFELSASRGRILHVEHIELLSPGQLHQLERVAELGRPVGGELFFSGSNAGWIGDGRAAGSPALRALARLHRLLDLFGAASVRGAALRLDGGRYRLEVDLVFAGGGETRLVEERGPELARTTRWAIRCEGGVLDDPPDTAPVGLFWADLNCFVDLITGRGSTYVSEKRVLGALALVEEIEAAL